MVKTWSKHGKNIVKTCKNHVKASYNVQPSCRATSQTSKEPEQSALLPKLSASPSVTCASPRELDPWIGSMGRFVNGGW